MKLGVKRVIAMLIDFFIWLLFIIFLFMIVCDDNGHSTSIGEIQLITFFLYNFTSDILGGTIGKRIMKIYFKIDANSYSWVFALLHVSIKLVLMPFIIILIVICIYDDGTLFYDKKLKLKVVQR